LISQAILLRNQESACWGAPTKKITFVFEGFIQKKKTQINAHFWWVLPQRRIPQQKKETCTLSDCNTIFGFETNNVEGGSCGVNSSCFMSKKKTQL